MPRLLILITALLMGAALAAQAQPGDTAQASAEEAAERDALREELAAARREVAEAARRLARIQRELADVDVEAMRFDRLEALEELEDLDVEMSGMGERIRREVVRGLRMTRPRLGLLLGGADNANEIVGVTPGSGAEKAGIESGDRLVSINGQEVDASEPGSLRSATQGIEPGESVPVEVERGGERLSFDVTASSPARDFRVLTHDLRGPPTPPGPPGAPRVDREIFVVEGNRPLPPEVPMPPRLAGLGRHSDMISNHAGLESYFGTAEGVVVLRIDADNPLGLEDGDVVLGIDGEAVSRPVEIGRALMGRAGQTVTLDVMRAGERISLEAALPEAPAVSALSHGPDRGL